MSFLIAHCSLLPAHCSLFPDPRSLFPDPRSLLKSYLVVGTPQGAVRGLVFIEYKIKKKQKNFVLLLIFSA